jgi:hypothetical protein
MISPSHRSSVTTHNTYKRHISPAGFERTFPASELLQYHTSDRTATGIGLQRNGEVHKEQTWQVSLNFSLSRKIVICSIITNVEVTLHTWSSGLDAEWWCSRFGRYISCSLRLGVGRQQSWPSAHWQRSRNGLHLPTIEARLFWTGHYALFVVGDPSKTHHCLNILWHYITSCSQHNPVMITRGLSFLE